MKTLTKIDKLNIACGAALLSSALFSILQSFLIAIPLLILGIWIYRKKLTTKNKDYQLDSDIVRFLSVLITEYSQSKKLLVSLERASKGNFIFSSGLESAIEEYKLGLPAEIAFFRLKTGSKYLNEIVNVIGDGLDEGTEIESALISIKERVAENDKYRLKSLGAFENAYSINSMGSAVFFPLFSGITIDIIKFAGSLNQQISISLTGLVIIFISYIVIANYLNALYGRMKGPANLLTKMALLSAIGILLFSLSSAFASTLLGE